MYARHVSLSLKPNTASELTQMLESEILPILRKQSGFLDEITLLDANGKDAIAISLWDRKDSADAYRRDTYALVRKELSKVVDGTPEVHTYEVANSTYHQIAAHN